ncbi:MAG: rod shape-determining protein [Candidatus Lloydbacteria bacterium RIFCSPHIGHO2_02_FULL_50_11]|nr:MAG: rod shape-determining protein [Candidatus Lloydbacteria bacterium RIFCSPHIGHO2_02_FULL_50_11]
MGTMMLDRFYKMVGSDIGIDLGTANTLVYLRDHGIIINEPSVVALNKKTNRVVAVGMDAKQMLGRTPGHVVAVRPLVEGVISDFEVTEEMLAHFINKAQKMSKRQGRPRIVVGVPSSITNVETRAVRDAAMNAGAREVFIVEEPMAAAIGIRLPIMEPVGSMVIDIGGGTTDIAVISLGGIVNSKNLKVAGDKFNSDIIAYIRDEFKILIGERTAENVKIAIGSAIKQEKPLEAPIRGRDLLTGLPREVIVTDSDIREALTPSIQVLVEATKEVLETTPPEILSDVMNRGMVLVGGGALILGIAERFSTAMKIAVQCADDPLTAVARGTGIMVENIDNYRDVLIEHDNELPPR